MGMSNQSVTKKDLIETLGEFTEETLLPGVSSIMDDKLASFSLEIDDKLADLKGDLIIMMRKEDRKLGALIGLLAQRKVISEKDAKQILSLEPFPKS
jgi:hypothetical protein